MLIIIAQWLMAIIAVESVTEIIVASNIMFGFRSLVNKISSFFGELVTCGYCLSVWISASIAFVMPGNICANTLLGIIVDFIIKTMVLHRMSNAFHGLVYIIINRPPFVIVITKPGETGSEQQN